MFLRLKEISKKMNNTVNDTQVSSIQRKYKETTHKEYEFMKKGSLSGVKSIYINLCVIMLNYECFSMNDVIVYSFLRECCRFTGHEKASTLVSNEKLSQLSGLSISTVKRSLENLKQYEIIKVEGRGAHNRVLSLQVDFLDTDFSKYLQDELKAKKMAENESKFANLSESVKRLIRKFNIVDLSFLEKDMKPTMTRLELESWIPELKYLFLKMGISKAEQNKAIKQFLCAANPYDYAKERIKEVNPASELHETEKIGIVNSVINTCSVGIVSMHTYGTVQCVNTSLDYSNFSSYFNSYVVYEFPNVDSFRNGGIIGMFLVATINSGLTYIGSNVIGSIFLVAGIFLAFSIPFIKCVKVISDYFNQVFAKKKSILRQ